MKWFKSSITKQLIFSIGGALFIVMTIASVVRIMNTKADTEQNVNGQINQLLLNNANSVTSFFESKAQIVETYTKTPAVINFLSSHDELGKDESANQNYHELIDFYKSVKQSEPTIRSVYTGINSTHEYYDETGLDTTGYSIKDSVWWNSLLKANKLFVANPTMLSMEDPTMVASLMKPIHGYSGELLGGGGIDIGVDGIGRELLSKARFQKQGEAFLITGDGSIVYFPNFKGKNPRGDLINEVDKQISHAKGFGQLFSQMKNSTDKQSTVEWQGKTHQVVWQPVESDAPYMRWYIAFMLPQSVTNDIINSAVLKETLTAILLIAIICFVVAFLAVRFKTQINELVLAMEEIAEGDGDLNRRITVERADELGQLGSAFNRFADQVHMLVAMSKDIAQTVTDKSDVAFTTWHNTRDYMNQQKSEVETSSAATVEMAQTSAEMARSADDVAEHADDANQQMIVAKEAVESAKQNMVQLGDQIRSTSMVVEELRENADDISGVLEVIRAVAEQTNLLALNAAIEAARAGEQGRGFAVVADEVRTLASKTQDSTTNIHDIIQKLQASSVAAEQAMNASCEKVEENAKASEELVDTLNGATSAVSHIQQQVAEISNAVSQQATVADEIAATVTQVKELSDDAITCGNELEVSFDGMSTSADQLSKSLDSFKV